MKEIELSRKERMTRYLFVLFSIVMFGIFSVVSTANAEEDVSRQALAELEKKVRSVELSNGLRVLLYRRGVAPVFAGAVGVRVGGVDEVVGGTGISHMLEHMAFKGTSIIGTKDFGRESKLLARLEKIVGGNNNGVIPEDKREEWESLHKELESLWIPSDFSRQYMKRGARGFNATTAKELTRYFVSFPRSAFEFWCWVESERILDPVMRQFYQERDVVLEERRMRYVDSPNGKLYASLLPTIFHKHPYRNPVIGYEFDLNALTATRTKEFMERYYVPRNMVVSLVGDIDPEKDIEIVEKYFGRIPDRPTPAHPDIVEPDQEGERRLSLELDSAPLLFVGYRKPQYPHKDDPPISVMLEILAGSKISPLYTQLVKRKQLASDLDVFEIPGQAYPNVFVFGSNIKNPHTADQFMREFDREIGKFLKTGATQKQLEIAKRSIAVSSLHDLNSNVSLALDFISSELLYDDWKATMDWYDQVMKVTVADINRVANQYLQKTARTIADVKKKDVRKKKV